MNFKFDFCSTPSASQHMQIKRFVPVGSSLREQLSNIERRKNEASYLLTVVSSVLARYNAMNDESTPVSCKLIEASKSTAERLV